MDVSWPVELVTGFREMDAQHEELVRHAAALLIALADGTDARSLERLYKRLSDSERAHFASEELLMLSLGYPALREHMREHDFLRRGTVRLGDDLHAGWPAADLLPGARDLFTRILPAHILFWDMALATAVPPERRGAGRAPARSGEADGAGLG